MTLRIGEIINKIYSFYQRFFYSYITNISVSLAFLINISKSIVLVLQEIVTVAKMDINIYIRIREYKYFHCETQNIYILFGNTFMIEIHI